MWKPRSVISLSEEFFVCPWNSPNFCQSFVVVLVEQVHGSVLSGPAVTKYIINVHILGYGGEVIKQAPAF